MANLDSSIGFANATGSLAIEDGGGNSINVDFRQGSFTFEVPGREYTEQKEAGRRAGGGAPILIEGGDQDVTGQFSFVVTSVRGSSNVHPYEALTFSGNASGWTSTARGDKKALKLTFTLNSTAGGGGQQTLTYNYAVTTNAAFDSAGVDGIIGQLTAGFTDHENLPAAA